MEYYYQIALTNVPFDNSYKNVLRFENRSEQETYFNVSSLFLNKPFVNFAVGSLIATNICYDCQANESINELLSKNYCIVKDTSPNKQLNYYYYFITNAKQENGERIYLSLELDVMQTYYLNLQFSDCLINRSHFNRWVDNGDGTVSFDGTPTSELFERESLQNVAKRLTKRSKVSFYDTSTEFGEWCDKNILGWCYIYLQSITLDDEGDIGPKYTFWENNDLLAKFDTYFPATKCITAKNSGLLINNTAVLTFPIMKLYSRIKLDNGDSTRSFYWGSDANEQASILEAFAMLNDGYTKVMTVKISPYPPSQVTLKDDKYTITKPTLLNPHSTLTILNCIQKGAGMVNPFVSYTFSLLNGFYNNNGNTFCVTPAVIHPKFSMVITYIDSYSTQETFDKYIVDKQFTFNKSEIIGADKNYKFNPKLLSSDYFNLRISDETENGFDYDLQKLNNNKLSIKYTNTKTPDTAKTYIRFKPSGLYEEGTDDNLTGFIGSDDNSIILATTAYQQMLANNKNYFLQNLTNIGFGTLNNIIGGATSGSSTGFSMSLLNSGIGIAQNVINQGLTVDNLKSAPNNIVNAKGNVFFQNMYSESGIIVEEYDILEAEKEKINDFMCMYGFTFNKLGNVKNYDNIRKFYNYIKADIEQVEGVGINISDNVHNKLRQIYSNGVRFWNIDTFAYNKENYENWLEE